MGGDAVEGVARPAVAVRAESVNRDARVTFADNGRGLDPVIARQLFQPFNSNRLCGLGLGLAYVQRVLALHGGSLTAGPRPDQAGAVVHVILPLAESPVPAGPGAAPGLAAGGRP